jgi:hypothetical protein
MSSLGSHKGKPDHSCDRSGPYREALSAEDAIAEKLTRDHVSNQRPCASGQRNGTHRQFDPEQNFEQSPHQVHRAFLTLLLAPGPQIVEQPTCTPSKACGSLTAIDQRRRAVSPSWLNKYEIKPGHP